MTYLSRQPVTFLLHHFRSPCRKGRWRTGLQPLNEVQIRQRRLAVEACQLEAEVAKLRKELAVERMEKKDHGTS